MAIYIHTVRIYLDTAPAGNADIGLYAVGGGNSQLRWAEIDLSSYSPTLAWKSGVIVPGGIGDITESIDLRRSGGLSRAGDVMVQVANTLSVSGSWTQFDKVLSDADIDLQNLLGEIRRFEISAGALVDADGTVIYTGKAEDINWTEKIMSIKLQTARKNREAYLGTQSEVAGGGTVDIPVTLGTMYPQQIEDERRDNFGAMVRTENTDELYLEGTEIWLASAVRMVRFRPNKPLQAYPVVGDNGAVPPLEYAVKVGESVKWYDDAGVEITVGAPSLDNLIGRVLRVVDGDGQGEYRVITLARVDIDNTPTVIDVTIADYFETTLAGNATATATDNSWVEIRTASIKYALDVWECRNWLNEEGTPVGEPEPRAYDPQSSVKVSALDTTTDVQTEAAAWARVPEQTFEDDSGKQNDMVLRNRSLHEDSGRVKDVVITPCSSIEWLSDTDLSDWSIDAPVHGSWIKLRDGAYGSSEEAPSAYLTTEEGAVGLGTDRNYATRAGITIYEQGSKTQEHYPGVIACLLRLPNPPDGFDFDSVYIGIDGWATIPRASDGVSANLYLQHQNWMGPVVQDLKVNITQGVSNITLTYGSLLDEYYTSHRPSRNNRWFYWADSSISEVYNVSGHATFQLDGVTDVAAYRALDVVLFALRVSYVRDNPLTGDVFEAYLRDCAVIFGKRVGIKDKMYTGIRGRIYGDTWD